MAALDEAGTDYVVRRYVEDPPTPAELGAVLERLGLEPWDLAHPRTLQRPIITAADGTTVVGRDPDALARVIAAR